MAGHSKWANIKHRKGAQDAKRGKIFTKMIKEITVAVKENGNNPDPDTNPSLRLAIQNAKGVNMPKDNIERAIKKASGESGEAYLSQTFEGYATNGVAVIVETLSDNSNRTISSVRSIFNKYGGSLGVNGSVDFMFERKGVFRIAAKNLKMDVDELTLELADAGAEELENDEYGATVYCAMEDFGPVNAKLSELEIEVENAELQRIPSTMVSVDDEALKKIMTFIETMEDDDDVQKVYHNLDVTDEQAASLA